ncbi:hypothetical protein [Candidatus Poriferisodalis sp.]|uniref:hypothetical protein n=1 Tax=Candidatus Poriferisodalis sp. TaxID=3101277 RepID=UPI003B02D174
MSSEGGVSAPEENTDDAPPRQRRKGHNHAAFLLASLSRYAFDYYTDRKVHPGRIGSGIDEWDDDDQHLAIEEGKRQLDAQIVQLQQIIRRASVLLPVGLAISVFFLTALDDAATLGQPLQTIIRVALLLGAAMTIWGTLVMGALIGARSTFMRTDTAQLTREPSGLRRYLARDYAENVETGENTIAARLTHLGTGVAWIVLGALIGAVGLAMIYWQPVAPVMAEPQCCVVECCETAK